MIDNRLKSCCEECAVITIKADTTLDVSKGHTIISNTVIYCAYESACKLLAAEKSAK